MPRRPSFRRDVELQAEVRRVNRNVQNKQSRIRMNKGLEVEGVETVKYTQFTSRKEINQYLNQMNKFLDKKADFTVENQKGMELKYSEVQKAEREVRRINKAKEKQWDAVKDQPYTYKGVKTDLTVAEFVDAKFGIVPTKYKSLKPIEFDVNQYQRYRDFKNAMDRMEKNHQGDFMKRRSELYRDNYLKALENEFGEMGKQIAEAVNKTPLDVFMKTYYTESNANINFVYDKVRAVARVKELERVWGVKSA